MTTGERRQPQSTFIEAGKTAFTIGVLIENNPYKTQPYRGWWSKGYRNAWNKFDRMRRAFRAA